MGISQRVRRIAAMPARTFFDRRFGALDASVSAATREARDDIVVARDQLLEEFDARLLQVAYDVAAVSRAHLESMSYVAAEMHRLDASLRGELHALGEQLATTPRLPGTTAASDPYAVRALAGLDRGAGVVAVGHHLDLAPLFLATLGHRVTALGDRPYPLSHPNLEALIGAPDDLAPNGERFDAVVVAPAAGGRELEPAAGLVVGGGLLVFASDAADADPPAGFELIDRTPDIASITLITARRATA